MKYLWSYTHYLKPHWKLFTFAFVCGLIYSLTSGAGLPVLAPKIFQTFLPEKAQGAVNHDLWEVISTAMILPGVFMVRGVFGFLNSYFMSVCSWRAVKGLKEDIFRKLQELPMSYFDDSTTGDILTRLDGDTSRVQDVVMEFCVEILRQPVIMISALGALVYLSWDNRDIFFLLGFLLASALFAVPVVLLRKKLKVRGRQLQENSASVTQVTKENVDAVQEVRTFNMEQQQRRFYGLKLDSFIFSQLKLIKYQRLQAPIMEMLAALIIGALFLYAYFMHISYGTFFGLGAALYMTFDPLKRILVIINKVHSVHGSLMRIKETLEMENPIEDPAQPTALTATKGEVSFHGVSFGYKSDIPVLHDVNVTIPAGQFCALVGPSGSGKSTFVKLIPRLYDPGKGSILIDGISNRDVTLHDLRSQISLVSQSPVLFNTSLMENIRLGRPGASDEEVLEAARKAYAHQFISDFEMGYDTLAGEDGNHLSGGQKQRVAIARAILRDAPILLLDEATSALDSESEAYIQAALKELVKDRTVISIAHRMSTFQHAERLLVFQSGRIIASGTHEDLMRDCEVYERLVSKQQ